MTAPKNTTIVLTSSLLKSSAGSPSIAGGGDAPSEHARRAIVSNDHTVVQDLVRVVRLGACQLPPLDFLPNAILRVP